jgi:hypothetical protein
MSSPLLLEPVIWLADRLSREHLQNLSSLPAAQTAVFSGCIDICLKHSHELSALVLEAVPLQAVLQGTPFADLLSALRQGCGQPARELPAALHDRRVALARRYNDKLDGHLGQWEGHFATHKDHPALAAFTQMASRVRNARWACGLADPATRALRVTKDDMAARGVTSRELAMAVCHLLSKELLSFPWKRFYHLPAQQLMANLRAHVMTPDLTRAVTPHNIRFQTGASLFPLTFDGAYCSFTHSPEDYKNMDVVVDLFQERARLTARRQDEREAPMVRWATDPLFVASVVEASLQRYGECGPGPLRESLYEMVKECTQFKPSLVAAVIRFFGATRMLDFSAGWGDRLAGAIAAGVERYQAFDPNTSLRAGHQGIIDAFVPEPDRARFAVTYLPFERAVVEPEEYDLVFTSPPFFDFEIYTSLPGQSVDTFKSYEAWLGGFLTLALHKSWSALKTGGHLVIHITDVYTTKVCEPMCMIIQAMLKGSEYRGCMCTTGLADKARPMWVFRKGEGDRDRAERAEKALQSLFPAVYAVCQETLKRGV